VVGATVLSARPSNPPTLLLLLEPVTSPDMVNGGTEPGTHCEPFQVRTWPAVAVVEGVVAIGAGSAVCLGLRWP
jgi:hypothetical protein